MFKKIKLFFKHFFCKHKEFKVSNNQLSTSGYMATIHQDCTSCGQEFIFRRKSEMSPWYRWDKA